MAPFLKWAGGKRWLADKLAPTLAKHGGRYFEPFLGSGAVYFHCLPAPAVLSDSNSDLIECYQTIRNRPGDVEVELRKLAMRHPDEAYYTIRLERPSKAPARAARFLYLNRTCWNGLYRVNLQGIFNVPRGTKTQVILDTDDFEATSRALASADIFCHDFEKSIDLAEEGDLIFADPPYSVTHNMNGFVKYNQNIFSWADQQRLAHCLLRAVKRGASVIATNADHPEVRNLYRDFESTSPLARASVIAASAAKRRATTELLITNLMSLPHRVS